MSLPYPQIDPVAVQLGPLPIRWYSLAYIGGLLAGWWYVARLLKTPRLFGASGPPIDRTKLDDVVFWVAIGVMLGGRLGYILFYEPSLFVAPWVHLGAGMADGPVKTLFGWISLPPALMLWQGGMSFHGGFLGVVVAGLFFTRRYKVDPFSLGDLFAAAAPIGLFFGRIANFINAELYGRPSDGPFAMRFPIKDATGAIVDWTEPRHPSQLYEAALEGIVLFAVVAVATHRFGIFKRPGAAMGIFLVSYALVRIFVENFREPDVQLPDYPLGLTMGMMLSAPMLAAGIWLLRRAFAQKPAGSAA